MSCNVEVSLISAGIVNSKPIISSSSRTVEVKTHVLTLVEAFSNFTLMLL